MKMKLSLLSLSVVAALSTALHTASAQTYAVPHNLPAIQAANARQAQSVENTHIRILPIDQAKFWLGQRFDFEVEVLADAVKDVEILVNGKPVETFFNGQLNRQDHQGYSSFRIDNVRFTDLGNVKIEVKADSDKGALSRTIQYAVVQEKADKKAKNVILFVGDGMSLQAKQAARILSKGIQEGRYNDLLAMESLPELALITTSGYDSLVTDSANSASAYNTGHKSVVNAMGVYENSTKDPLDDPRVENINEIIQRTKGMSVGIVSTASVTDATPAAVASHTRRRAEQAFIAQDFLDKSRRPEVLLGGGIRYFTPKATKGSKRDDERNIVEDFTQEGFQYVGNRKELLSASNDKPLLGLFAMNHMNVYFDREFRPNKEITKGFDDQPNLVEMTAKAIDILSKNPNGFFLMAEGASIDKQLHAMDWHRATYDTIEFDQAIAYAKKWAKEQGDETLIIVVADHAHGISLTGTYHEKDGKVGREGVRIYEHSIWPSFKDENVDGFPDNPEAEVTLAVQYANFPDHHENYHLLETPTDPTVKSEDGKMLANPKRAYNDSRYIEGNIPHDEDTEVHAADDVVLMAGGPGSEYFKGIMDNTEVFFGIMRALHVEADK